MKILTRRIMQVFNVIHSYLYKWSIDYGWRKINTLLSSERKNKIIVTLTSYGRRVENNVVYYTLVSILNQSVQPDKIILWLDDVNWNINNLPIKLKELIRKGVEVKFCKDLKSYKKLIPALEMYHDDILVTVDDDVIYPRDLIETFYIEHKKKPKSVICGRGSIITKNSKGDVIDYNEWESAKCYDERINIVPIGVGGVLYPPRSFYKDVLLNNLFMNLAPNADDLWFWVMEYLNGTSQVVVKTKSSYLSFDALYQYFHKGSALTHSNAKEGKNNIQLGNIINYYSIKLP